MHVSMHNPTKFSVARNGDFLPDDRIIMTFLSGEGHIDIMASPDYVKTVISQLEQQLKFLELRKAEVKR